MEEQKIDTVRNSATLEPKFAYNTVDDLFGRIMGIERVLLVDRQKDSILSVIEKIVIIPENKLVTIEPVQFMCGETIQYYPRVNGVISLSDV